MMRLAATYESRSIVATLARQLTWSHFLQLIALEDAGERRFYEELASRDRWRITVDGDYYYLDLLFHHYVMRCFVAVELKTRKLQLGDKGQMELYLRWLDRYERVPGWWPRSGSWGRGREGRRMAEPIWAAVR
jgi:hypothetical protein